MTIGGCTDSHRRSQTAASALLDEKSDSPQPGAIACKIVREWVDDSGRKRCIINTEQPWDVTAQGGETQFDVFRDQVPTGNG